VSNLRHSQREGDRGHEPPGWPAISPSARSTCATISPSSRSTCRGANAELTSRRNLVCSGGLLSIMVRVTQFSSRRACSHSSRPRPNPATGSGCTPARDTGTQPRNRHTPDNAITPPGSRMIGTATATSERQDKNPPPSQCSAEISSRYAQAESGPPTDGPPILYVGILAPASTRITRHDHASR
jgi:hypothetical protein